ncbi:MAG TPA: hypothetical protein VF405_07975 [Gammaproteobacteria bacterium]
MNAKTVLAAAVVSCAVSCAAFAQQPDESWREIADANAAVYAKPADDDTVFYANIGEHFFLPNGSYNYDYCGMPGPAGVGMQPPAFEVWAEELEPWLDRFVR